MQVKISKGKRGSPEVTTHSLHVSPPGAVTWRSFFLPAWCEVVTSSGFIGGQLLLRGTEGELGEYVAVHTRPVPVPV